jgi:magnesium chelatase family protein
VRSLADLVSILRGELPLERVTAPQQPPVPSSSSSLGAPDLADIRGLELPKQALAVMLAGGHNLLLHGPPGVGKTLLARRVPGLLPPLEDEDALMVTKIDSVTHRRIPGLVRSPPVRMIHHTVSLTGLLGGGNPPRPGEVTLAHLGVLFLDELPEFARGCLEGLREPLEDGGVTIVRARYALHYPARFQLMAAMNRCPCGYLGHPERVCTDSPAAIQRYQDRVKNLMPHFDLVVSMKPPPFEDVPVRALFSKKGDQSSAAVRQRIEEARVRQQARFVDTPWHRNAEIPSTGNAIEQLCPLSARAKTLLERLARGVLGRARGYNLREIHRLRLVARTIQDLERAYKPTIDEKAIATAMQMQVDLNNGAQ